MSTLSAAMSILKECDRRALLMARAAGAEPQVRRTRYRGQGGKRMRKKKGKGKC